MIIMGRVVTTAGVASEMESNKPFAKFVVDSLDRYNHHDWGEMCDEDKASNDSALKNGDARLFAAYELKDGVKCEQGSDKIWIITEWDRSVTTILFPDEY